MFKNNKTIEIQRNSINKLDRDSFQMSINLRVKVKVKERVNNHNHNN